MQNQHIYVYLYDANIIKVVLDFNVFLLRGGSVSVCLFVFVFSASVVAVIVAIVVVVLSSVNNVESREEDDSDDNVVVAGPAG